MNKSQLVVQRNKLRNELNQIEGELSLLESLERPFKAAILSRKGSGKMSFKTEEDARKKYEEYCGKDQFRGGTSHGAYLYKLNKDGSKTLLDHHAINNPDFFPYEFSEDEAPCPASS